MELTFHFSNLLISASSPRAPPFPFLLEPSPGNSDGDEVTDSKIWPWYGGSDIYGQTAFQPHTTASWGQPRNVSHCEPGLSHGRGGDLGYVLCLLKPPIVYGHHQQALLFSHVPQEKGGDSAFTPTLGFSPMSKVLDIKSKERLR